MTTLKLRDVPWFCSWTLNTLTFTLKQQLLPSFFTPYLCSCFFFFRGASSNIYLWLWPSTQAPHVIPLEPQLLPTISSNGEGISRIVPPKSWRSLHKVSFPVRGAILLTKNGERISFPPQISGSEGVKFRSKVYSLQFSILRFPSVLFWRLPGSGKSTLKSLKVYTQTKIKNTTPPKNKHVSKKSLISKG